MADKAPWEDDPIVIPAEDLRGKAHDVAGPGAGGNPWDNDPIVEPAKPVPMADDGVRTSMEAGMRQAARKRRSGANPGRGTSLALGFTDWGGMGFADELVGGLGATFSYLPGSDWDDESFGERYSRIKQRYEDNSDAAWENHPWLYGAGATLGGLGSAVLTPEVKVSKLLTGSGRALDTLRLPGGAGLRAAGVRKAATEGALSTGAATGALWGGIGGAGQGDDLAERAMNSGLGVLIGGVAGGTLSRGAEMVSDRITARAGRRAIEDAAADAFGDEAGRFGIRTSRGDRTGDIYTQAKENSMANTGLGEAATGKAQAFRSGQAGDIETALDDLGARLGGPSAPRISQPHEGGELLQNSIRSRYASEAGAAGISNADDVHRAQIGGNAMELGFGNGAQLVDNEIQAADQVGRRVRSEQASSAAARDAAYEAARNTSTQIRREAIDGMDQRVMEDLTYGRSQPVIVDQNTPVAQQALKIISDVTEFRAPINRADPTAAGVDPATITHVNPQGIEQVRKRLVAMKQSAFSAGRATGRFEDYRATSAILDEFDNQLDRAVTYGMFDGDPAWLDAYRAARSAHAQHRRTYRPDDDLRTAMRAIVERDATPEQVANYLFGQSKLGNNNTSAKLADHLRSILGETSEEWAAIRQAAWQKLLTTGTRENETRTITRANAERIASQIQEFTTRRGSSFANTIFRPGEITMMNRFANGLRAMAASERTVPAALEEMMAIAGRDMNPARVAEVLVGGQKALGKNDNSWRLVDAIESVYGKDSPEWAAVRQTVWKQLTATAEGRDPKGAKLLSSNILEFIGGQGAPAARKMFAPDEIAEMRSIANILKRIAGTAEAKNPSNTSPHMSRLLEGKWRNFMTGLGVISGGADGGATAFAAAQGTKMLNDALNGRKADRLFSGRRDRTVSDFVKDKGDAFLLRQSRRGALGAPVLGGHELAPAGTELLGQMGRAVAGDEEQRPQ